MNATCDTNVYRLIANGAYGNGKAFIENLKEKEKKKGVLALQGTFVLQELFKHLDETDNPNYDNCRDAIILSTIHCQDYELLKRKMLATREFYSKGFSPNSELALVRWVADFLNISDFPLNSTIRPLMNADLEILGLAHGLTISEDGEMYLDAIRQNIKIIKSNLHHLRMYFYEAIKEIYDFVNTPGGWKFPEEDKNELKKLRGKHLTKIEEIDGINYLEVLTAISFLLRDEVVKTFPFKFYKAANLMKLSSHLIPDGIIEKFISDFNPFLRMNHNFHKTTIMNPENLANIETSKSSKARWNDFFDMFIMTSALANNTILITNETDIINAYVEAGMRDRVMKFDEYLSYLDS